MARWFQPSEKSGARAIRTPTTGGQTVGSLPSHCSLYPQHRVDGFHRGIGTELVTDSGVSEHGENAREFELMVAGGMPPMKAIQSATLEAARLLKIDDQLGTLEANKIADVVAVHGNPLEDIGEGKATHRLLG